jgi:hypothetical protein
VRLRLGRATFEAYGRNPYVLGVAGEGTGSSPIVDGVVLGNFNGANFLSSDLTGPYDPRTIDVTLKYRYQVQEMFGLTSTDALARGRFALVNTTVPEPSTWVLLASGLAAIGTFAARRKRTN